MAGRDNVLFHARLTTTTSAGTVVPLTVLEGIENVRQGYGTPVLKSVRGLYAVAGTDTNVIAGIPMEIKNSNWIDSAGVLAQKFGDATSLGKNTLGFMRGRDKQILPNSSWIVQATLPATWTYNASTAPYLDLYALIEIEYSAVEGINTENTTGSPVMKQAINASVTGSANTKVNIGSFDNLLQGVQYVMSEVSQSSGVTGTAQFIVIEGFSNQRGLERIIPIKNDGIADQIAGSTYLTKQTYGLSMISNVAYSASAIQINMEMIASQN